MKQYLAGRIRNVALAGHSDSGKTSLAEAMLYKSGASERLGKIAEGNTALFPDRVNAEFARIIDRSTIEMRVYERGAGETLACGTGTCATVVAAILNGYVDNEVTVHLLGGDLKIEWSGNKNDSVIMTGPAAYSFTGEVEI